MDDRAEAVVHAFYGNRRFCVWAAAYVLSHADLARGGSPAEVVKTVQAAAWKRNYQLQAAVLNSLSAACAHHGVTWQEVGVGGNV